MRVPDSQHAPNVTREALRRYFPGGGLGYRILVLPEYGCLYVKNAKAACSAITLWLHRIHTGDHAFHARNIHANHELPRPRDVGWDNVIAMLNGSGFRFTFVRDPIGRVESAYHDKIVRVEKGHLRVELQRVLGLPEEPDRRLSLGEFVAALETQEPLRMDPHFRPQHLNLMHPLVTYDLVGRLETFEADLARLRDRTGLPDVPLEVRNRSGRPAESLFDGHPGLLRRVRDIYAEDFELYGY